MVVKIKTVISLIFIFFSFSALASNNIRIIRDAEIEFFLQKIIDSITKNIDNNNQTFYPRLIFKDEYNAFVTGSNNIYINTGLIKRASSISEIQGVIAHEIGHLVLNHHSSRLINRNTNTNYATIAAIAGVALSMSNKLNSDAAAGLIIGSNDLATKSYLQFTRIQEQQADKFALDIMRKAKISYDGLENLLIRLSEEEFLNKSMTSKFYRSHPYSKKRLNQLQNYKKESLDYDISNEEISINDNVISLEYINNKIKSYNSDPFEILNNSKIENKFLRAYSKTIAYFKVGKFDLAMESLNNINNLKNYPFFYELQGDIYFAKSDFNNAISNYEKSINLLVKDYDVHADLIKLSLAKTYIHTNNFKKINNSILILEELLRKTPKWIFLWRLLAKASGKINKKEISFIALAEVALIKKNFKKAKKYVRLAFKYPELTYEYRLRGKDILFRIEEKK